MAKNGHIQIGQLGEDIATGYLENRGFRVIERNYRKKWGEIDIVAKKDNVLHFVEVKAGSVRGVFPKPGTEQYMPEDHIDTNKKARLKRAIETYLHERNYISTHAWTADVVVIRVNKKTQVAKVTLLRDVSLE